MPTKKSTFINRLSMLRPEIDENKLWWKFFGINPNTWIGIERGATPSADNAEKIRQGLRLTGEEMYWCLTGFGDIAALTPKGAGGSTRPVRKRKREAM